MLTLERIVADSHDDYSTWASVSVGFADDRSFVVEFHFKDYDAAASEDGDFSSDYILQASVDYEAAAALSSRLGVRLTKLPDAVCDLFSDGKLDSGTAGHVRSIYGDILGFIEGKGFRYKEKKIPVGNVRKK